MEPLLTSNIFGKNINHFAFQTAKADLLEPFHLVQGPNYFHHLLHFNCSWKLLSTHPCHNSHVNRKGLTFLFNIVQSLHCTALHCTADPFWPGEKQNIVINVRNLCRNTSQQSYPCHTFLTKHIVEGHLLTAKRGMKVDLWEPYPSDDPPKPSKPETFF